MSLKRTNYLCGHRSCDNKKCSVRLNRELTLAAYQVLERRYRDNMRKERLPSHLTEAGEDIPDLATLDLPLIEDSDTKISSPGVKRQDVEEIDGDDTAKRLKGMREHESSRQSDGLTSESSINSAKSNRANSSRKTVGFDESRKKNVPRSTYGPGSDYLKYGGMEVLDRQASSKVKSSKREITRSKVASSKPGSSRLTNVNGESCSSTDPKSHSARMNFVKYQNKYNYSKPDETCKNQLEEPIIIESKRRSSSARPNSKSESNPKPSAPPLNKKSLTPGSSIPDRVDDKMEVLFQYNSWRLTQPKFQVLDLSALPSDNKSHSGEVDSTTETANMLITFPSSWDAFNSEDSDTPVNEEPCQIETRSHQKMSQWPTDTAVMSKNASNSLNVKDEDLVTIPESSLRTSDPEDTCVSRNLKKEIASNTPGKMPASYSARKPLPSIQEVSRSVGRYSSDISTGNECKTRTLTTPQTATKPTGAESPKPRTADASSARQQVSSRSASGASPSATKHITADVRSRTASISSKTATDSTQKVVKSRTSSAGSTASGRSTSSSAKCTKSRSSLAKPNDIATPTARVSKSRIPIPTCNVVAAPTARVSKSRIPIPIGKVAADANATVATTRIPTTSTKQVVVTSQTPSPVARTDDNCATKQLNGRQSSRASTNSETPAVSTTKVGRNRPSSPGLNTPIRKPSTPSSTKSRTSIVSNPKSVKSRPLSAASSISTDQKILNGRRPSTASSTKSKTSTTSNPKSVKSRPSTETSTCVTNRKILSARRPSMASTKSKTSTIYNPKVVKSRPSSAASRSSTDHKMINGRRPSTASSTKSRTSIVSNTKSVNSRPTSAASNASTLKSRHPSSASTKSKPDTESAKQVAQTKAPSGANPSRIPVPIDSGSRPIRSRHLSNVAPKVDCRRPLTAVVNKLSPNVKLVEERSRPQSSGNEGQSETSSKPRLARPASELKREPIQIQLGTKSQCVEGEHVKVVKKPEKFATNQSSDENNALPVVQGKSSLQRSFHTKTACKGRDADRISSKSSSGGKEGVFEKSGAGPQQSLVPNPASKIPLPVNPVSRERLTLRDKTINSRSTVEEQSGNNSRKAVRKTNIPSISHIFDEMLEEKSMSSSEKAVLLKMNRALIKAGKIKPMREVQSRTTPKGSKENLVKANTELEDKVKGILPQRKLSKANVRDMISLFDPCNASVTSGATGIAAQRDELLDDDYASLLELDDSTSVIDSRKLKNSLTASMVEFVRDGNLQVPRKIVDSDEHNTERPENSTLSNGNR